MKNDDQDINYVPMSERLKNHKEPKLEEMLEEIESELEKEKPAQE